MGTGRDDFTKDTIRKAAGRVGYRCSFPNCPNATIGASMESPNKTSVTGVAAHICAAAEGGPRYDQKMSVDERRSVENCIWLCQTHSKLIDTSIVYLTHLGLDGNTLSELSLMCSSYVKNQLLNDINEELSAITDENQKATMFFEGGKLSLLEQTSDMRRARFAFLSRLKAFAESLQTANHLPAFSSCNPTIKNDIESTLSKNQLYCESTSLSATKNTNNAVLVTDDQFLFALATMEGISNIGITGMLAHTSLSWDKLLSVSKKLKEMGERMRPGYLTTSFPKFLESHGMPHMRFHDLRHSCASLLLANGVPLKHIQEWLGHSDFSTTANIYAHLDYTSKITSAQAMESGITLPSSQFSSRWTDDLDDDFTDTDEQI